MNRRWRRWWFKNYWWVLLGGLVVLLWLVGKLRFPWEAAMTGAGALLGMVFLVQQQKLRELSTFKELFTEFNERYEKLNDALTELLNSDRPLSLEDRKRLDEYVNLCAEEFLFWTEGLIHPRAWRSWCLGIKTYLADSRICDYWEASLKDGSCYGLSTAAIESGARLEVRS